MRGMLRYKRGLVVSGVALLGVIPAVALSAAGDPAGTATFGDSVLGVGAQADGSVVAVGQSGSNMLVRPVSAALAPAAAFSAGSGVARAVVVQPDGKIVVAGQDSGMVIRRFNADGTADTSFGTAGTVRFTQGASANAVALAPCGQIVVAGSATAGDGYPRVAVARVTSSGAPDTSFGPGGFRVLDIARNSQANAVAVQADGKVVYAGQSAPQLQVTGGFVSRVNADGTTDTSFNNGNVYNVDGQGSANLVLNAVAIDGSGRIVAAGGAVTQSNDQAIFVRLSSGGSLDGSFGSAGVSRPASSSVFLTENVGVRGLAILSGGRILGAGSFQSQSGRQAALYAVTDRGALDTSFGSGGIVTTSPGEGGGNANAVTVAPNGNLYSGGTTVAFTSNPAGFVTRFASLGTPLPAASCPAGGGTGTGTGSTTTGTSTPATSTPATSTPTTSTPSATTPLTSTPTTSTPTTTTPKATSIHAAVSAARLSRSSVTSSKSAKLTFALTRASTVTLTLEQKRPGRTSSSGKCSKASGANRHGKKCSYYSRLTGSKRLTGKSGTNSVTITRRFGSRTLSAGTYHLELRLTNGSQDTVTLKVTSG